MTTRGIVFIVCAPSGGGKTTLIRMAQERLQEHGVVSHFSISHTTRGRRPAEVDGRDYHFVDRPTFEQMVAAGAFLEWAEYAGNLYGTSREQVEERLAAGEDVYLDIEVQGARQVLKALPEAVSVFILPPSYGVLKERLESRKQDSPEAIERRLRWSQGEMREAAAFEYVMINDRLEAAVQTLVGISLAEHHRTERMKPLLDSLQESFQRSLDKDLGP
jgi:guanylate kinase